jgi:hypothetical protein
MRNEKGQRKAGLFHFYQALAFFSEKRSRDFMPLSRFYPAAYAQEVKGFWFFF